MSPQFGWGNSGPVWEPWPSRTTAFASTVMVTYGFVCEDVRWQRVTLPAGSLPGNGLPLLAEALAALQPAS